MIYDLYCYYSSLDLANKIVRSKNLLSKWSDGDTDTAP